MVNADIEHDTTRPITKTITIDFRTFDDDLDFYQDIEEQLGIEINRDTECWENNVARVAKLLVDSNVSRVIFDLTYYLTDGRMVYDIVSLYSCRCFISDLTIHLTADLNIDVEIKGTGFRLTHKPLLQKIRQRILPWRSRQPPRDLPRIKLSTPCEDQFIPPRHAPLWPYKVGDRYEVYRDHFCEAILGSDLFDEHGEVSIEHHVYMYDMDDNDSIFYLRYWLDFISHNIGSIDHDPPHFVQVFLARPPTESTTHAAPFNRKYGS